MNGTRRVVQFDVDGVLADFSLGFTHLANQKFGVPLISQRDKATWDGFGLCLEDESAIWDMIRESSCFWKDLDPLVDAKAMARIHRLHLESDVYFVTKRSLGRMVKLQTEYWLERQGIQSPTVLIAANKAAVAHALRVDFSLEDKIANAVQIAGGRGETRSFIIDRPYNKFNPLFIGVDITRVYHLEEFLDHIEEASPQTGAVSA